MKRFIFSVVFLGLLCITVQIISAIAGEQVYGRKATVRSLMLSYGVPLSTADSIMGLPLMLVTDWDTVQGDVIIPAGTTYLMVAEDYHAAYRATIMTTVRIKREQLYRMEMKQ